MGKLTLFAVSVLLLFFSASQVYANNLCDGKEGYWIAPPKQEPSFGNFYLGGMCDNNSCYHITISNDDKGEDMLGLAFTCEDIGDGKDENLWVFVDVESGEKQEVNATLQEVNDILKEALSE